MLNPLTLLLPALLLLTACSTFDRKWNQQATQPAPPPETLTGNWTGTWHSDSGHGEGELLAAIVPTPTPDNPTTTGPAIPPGSTSFEATFKATWAKILKSDYTVTLIATPTPEGLSFTGTKDLGPLAGGVYQYAGTAKADHFHSTYTSKHDSGTFTLTRNR